MFQNIQLFQPFRPGDTIFKSELVLLLQKQYPDAKPATLDWHIYDLVRQGLLTRQGRGLYQIVLSQSNKAVFAPTLPKEVVNWGTKLKEGFPLLTTCLWSTSILHSFTMHLPFVSYWIVETERDAVSAIFNHIQATQTNTSPVLLAADIELSQQYFSGATTLIVIKPLISEAPMRLTTDGLTVPTAEKILVDLLADTDVFNLFTEEMSRIFEEMNERYILNIDRMRRYARRRHKLPLLENILLSYQAKNRFLEVI